MKSYQDDATHSVSPTELQATLVLDLSVEAVEQQVRHALPSRMLFDHATFTSEIDGAVVRFRWDAWAGCFSGACVHGEIRPGRGKTVLRYEVTQTYWSKASVNAVVLPIAFSVLFGPWAVLLAIVLGFMVGEATSPLLGVAAGLAAAVVEAALAGLFVCVLWSQVGNHAGLVDQRLRGVFAEHDVIQ